MDKPAPELLTLAADTTAGSREHACNVSREGKHSRDYNMQSQKGGLQVWETGVG